MKKLPKQYRICSWLLCITVALFIFSCRSNDKNKILSVENGPSYLPPVSLLVDTMLPPKKTELKNVPPPHVITVPKTLGRSYKGFIIGREDELINLLPPAVTKVPLPVAHFDNFNTKDGLPLPGAS